MRDLFDWADERRCTVIDAEKLFETRRQAALTRLIFGPPLPKFNGIILPFTPPGRAPVCEWNAQDKPRAAQ